MEQPDRRTGRVDSSIPYVEVFIHSLALALRNGRQHSQAVGVVVVQAHVLDVVDGLVEHGRDVIVAESVHNLPTVALGAHKIEVPQQTELMGHRGLLHPDVLGERHDGRRSLPQPHQNVDPTWGREGLAQFGDRLGQFSAELRRSGERTFDDMAHAGELIRCPMNEW